MNIKHSASFGVLEVTHFSPAEADTLAKATVSCNVRSMSRVDNPKTILLAGHSSLTAHLELGALCNVLGIEYPKRGGKSISFSI